MKPLFASLFASLLLLGAATSCSKTDAAPQDTFFVQATKDSSSWSVKGSGSFSKSQQQFYLSGLVGDAARAESLALNFKLPAFPRPTPVQAFSASWQSLIGYDGVNNSYGTADAASLPTLEITRVDTVAKVVEGRFKALLVRDKHWTSQTEVMHFTNGSFRVQYTTLP
jgi:hypothetical protein